MAAQWWGYRWEKFTQLDADEQAFLIAVYRTNNQIEAVIAYKRYQEQLKAARKRK